MGAGTAKFFEVMMWIDGTPALSTIGDILARGSVQASTRSWLVIRRVLMTTVEVRSGEGFSHEQQLNNSDLVSVRVEEIGVFQARDCGQ